jgi:hypothetical protein
MLFDCRNAPRPALRRCFLFSASCLFPFAFLLLPLSLLPPSAFRFLQFSFFIFQLPQLSAACLLRLPFPFTFFCASAHCSLS